MDDIQVNDANPQLYLHQMRITSHGKMHDFVEFALNHFKVSAVVFRIGDLPDEGNVAQNNSDVPLSLHTLPAAKTIIVVPVQVPQAQDAPKDTRPDAKERGISISTSTIPRLISVVEIIKREYLKTLKVTHSRVLSGLCQYNEIGYLERHELQQTMPSEEDRTRALAMALEGKQ
jgi:hypothetical protein